MKKVRLFAILGVGALLALSSLSASANLLVNGDFEEDTFGIPGYIPGWNTATFWWGGWGTAAPALDVKPGYDVFTGTGIPFSGDYLLGTAHSGHANFHVGAYQTFSVEVGVEYIVSGGFMGGVEQSADTSWWEVKISNGTTTDPDAPGVIIAKNERGPNEGFFQFRESFENTFVADDTTATIFLKWGRAGSGDYKMSAAGFDNLNVEVVPEPASMLVLGSGIAGLAGIIRRKRA